jgi:hypothetical protein
MCAVSSFKICGVEYIPKWVQNLFDLHPTADDTRRIKSMLAKRNIELFKSLLDKDETILKKEVTNPTTITALTHRPVSILADTLWSTASIEQLTAFNSVFSLSMGDTTNVWPKRNIKPVLDFINNVLLENPTVPEVLAHILTVTLRKVQPVR